VSVLRAVSAAVEHFESGVKEVDVKLSVRGGDRGIGAPRQKAEVYHCAFLFQTSLSQANKAKHWRQNDR